MFIAISFCNTPPGMIYGFILDACTSTHNRAANCNYMFDVDPRVVSQNRFYCNSRHSQNSALVLSFFLFIINHEVDHYSVIFHQFQFYSVIFFSSQTAPKKPFMANVIPWFLWAELWPSLMLHWLEPCTAHLQVVDSNSAHMCACGICFLRELSLSHNCSMVCD